MKIAQSALPHWGLGGGTVTLIAARENAVYRVDHPSGPFALRVHRTGYRTDSQLAAELDWMAMLDQAGLSVPAPIPALNGKTLQIVGGSQVDVLTWLSGGTLVDALPHLDADQRAALFGRLGRTMAHMHSAIDGWAGASQCDRPAWDAAGLLGDSPMWDRFWDNPGLTPEQTAQMVAFRARATTELHALAPALDYGLIHADLVPANVMMSGDKLHFIDFDDGGFGFRLFDVATALFKLSAEPDYATLHHALLSGYSETRAIEASHLPLFMALRAASYVGWNITRAQEPGAGDRNARFIAEAQTAIAAYMS